MSDIPVNSRADRSGVSAIVAHENVAFGGRDGFTFVAHEKGDAKRGFHHVENNFCVGAPRPICQRNARPRPSCAAARSRREV